MKLEVTLAVSAEDFYEVIINSVIEDIKVNTEKEVIPYVGYRYKKNLKRYNKSSITTEFEITDLIVNELYAFKVITPVEITYVSYEIAKLNDESILVKYEERAESDSKRVGVSHKMMGAFFGTFFGKRKMKKRFHAIENYIKNK